MSYNNHITSASDLITTHEATRAGFISIALEKNIKASPFIQEAKSLRAAAKNAKTPIDLLTFTNISSAMYTASGLSDKSLNHLSDEDKQEALRNLIKNFLEPAGDDFVDELVYRFLLTRGDTLGGMMRNITGFLAEKKLIRCLISNLSISGVPFKYLERSGIWKDGDITDTTIESKSRGIYWTNGKGNRTLILNLTPPILKKNVDLCLFNSKYNQVNIKDASEYLALGELKGGIDPAGADEHWKTANSALNRIKDAYEKLGYGPERFFIGAAIEKSMAGEIYKQLQGNDLSNAANLTKDDQLNSICNWICSL